MNRLWLILISFLFFAACKKISVPLTDSAKNSMNFGLIGLSGNNLYLNKVNVITSYDFNGNKIKTLKTYDLLNYQKMVVGDSILALSKQLYTLYRLEPSGKLTEIQNGGNLRPISTIDEVRLADSVLVVLGNRYTSPKQQLDDIYDAPCRSLVLLKYDLKSNSVYPFEKVGHLDLEATSFAIVNDSNLFFMNNNISMINLSDQRPEIVNIAFNFNPENNLTTSVARGAQVITSNSKSIYFFDYDNNNLTLKGEIK